MRGRTRSKSAEPAVFDCLTAGRRRVALSVLESADALPVDSLAARVAARSGDGTTEREIRVSLHHVDLPKLEGAGLVDRDDGSVRIADHQALADPAVRRAVEEPAPSDGRLGAVYAALADARRQRVLRALATTRRGLAPRELAVVVAAEEADSSPETVPAEEVDRVHAMLHHVHLPKLVDAGLVEREGGVVTRDAVDLPGRWPTTEVESLGAGAG